jgi:hypothetical protein
MGPPTTMHYQGVKAPTVARPCPQAICRSLLACGTAWTSRVDEAVACAGPWSLRTCDYLITRMLMSNGEYGRGRHLFRPSHIMTSSGAKRRNWVGMRVLP